MDFTVGDTFIQNATTTPAKSWVFTHPAESTPPTPRRVEAQWHVDDVFPQYLGGDIARFEFTVTGRLGPAATTLTEDHWHVVCQLWGPADDPAAPWDRFVKHGVKIKKGVVHWYGGDAHPLHQWTQAESRAYEIPIADFVNGGSYKVVVEARMSDHPDGWISVWCNGALWPVGEKWRPQGAVARRVQREVHRGEIHPRPGLVRCAAQRPVPRHQLRRVAPANDRAVRHGNSHLPDAGLCADPVFLSRGRAWTFCI